MCGINGIIWKKPIHSKVDLKSLVELMNSAIIHRGPDDSGCFCDDHVALGMQRLSIIDVNSGGQPMFSSDNSIVVVFNGEIFNYLEIRNDLIKNKSVQFNTLSDTEVILKGYEVYGCKIFAKLNGMFSIAIYDQRKREVIIARDRTGEKPLYYWKNESNFVYCSELKSLYQFWDSLSISKPAISAEALNLYFRLTYIPAPFSIYDGVFKLEPGKYLVVNVDSQSFIEEEYWEIATANQDVITDYSEAKRRLKDLVYDSVERRMISDVPYGAFLSGGVDSSIVVAIMADLKSTEKIKTFSIISDNKKYDESARSNAVAKHCKTEHLPILLNLDFIKSSIDSIINNFDEPFADSSALPAHFVSQVTRRYVTVALTGDGGDEVFGGYNRYLMSHYASMYKRIVPNFLHDKLVKPIVDGINLRSDDRGVVFKIKKFTHAVSSSEFNDTVNIMSMGFGSHSLEEYLNPNWYFDQWESLFIKNWTKVKDLTSLKKARYLDIKISLEGDMLVKVDRVSMHNSLECRPPFLDHRLIDFSFQLPDNFLIGGGTTKKILKDTFEDMLPKGLFSLSKSGFGIPVGDWIRTYLRDDLLRWTSKDYLLYQGIFNPAKINQLVADHIQGKSDSTFKVWTFYCFQKWWDANCKD
jgi:asparagine synthase (glutamine-hydrolysing)